MRKQPYTIPIWAHKISVEQKPEELIVTGERHIMSPASGIDVDTDLLGSSKPLGGDEKRRKMPPHVEFANATTDAKLVEFVRKWGPVDGYSCLVFGGSSRDAVLDTFDTGIPKRLHMTVTTSAFEIKVTQSLAELRSEQKIFSGAARLIAEIQKEKPNADLVFDHYSQLPESEERELFSRIIKSRIYRGRPLASAACQRAQVVLCHLLDRFPASLQLTKRGAVELPLLETRGIRGVLYFFLRLEYLQAGRLGLGVCPRDKCDKVFVRDRRGTVYCDELCSKNHRSLEYYNSYGRAKRRERNRNRNS